MMQHHQFLPNGLPFPSFSPPFVPDAPFLSQEMSCSLPPSIDVDQSLSNVFSLLNLSPPAHSDHRRGRIGCAGSSVGEGFLHHPVGNPRMMHSDLGLNNPFTMDPHHHHRRRHHHRLCNNTDALQMHSSSGFDYGFDIDQKSRLGSTKFLYSTQQLVSLPRCSSNNASQLIDKMFVPINNELKFQRSDDDKHLNPPCYNSNHLCGVELSRFQNQNHQFMSSWSLKELKGRIYALAKDQNGCRILQAMFERPTMEEVQMVLSEVVDSISDLMKDQFGNYLVQKLVVLCNNDQKLQILISLIKVPTNIILVCMNPHGTRAVQKLLENLKDPNQIKLVMKALHHGAATLANDPNGHHVIQYCLVNFHSDINKPILTEIADECFKVATDRSGCCVLQACVEHSRGEVRTRLVAEIMANSVHLAEDPFGNYVLQHMLGLHIPEFTLLLVRQLQGNFASLSCNKYGSNVVEKCLKESGEEVSTRIILEIIRSPNSYLLLVDPYANFVIQSALKVSKGFAHECLCGLISKHTSSMRSNLYGKKILERFEKRRS
ncbi:pumilio homolog 12-like [Cynara cardunculus var. scolymus]|uniref:pumilio homolog 12-like n=1 Tax=Cynara cardunculus var. scolymus TaxID=59895 RepID=UPI000D62B7DB|nr:pumilio homolog 12-like [Cynara cardunculus var. scolymus]